MATYYKLKAQRCQPYLQERTTFTNEILLELLSRGVLTQDMLEHLRNLCQKDRVVYIVSRLARAEIPDETARIFFCVLREKLPSVTYEELDRIHLWCPGTSGMSTTNGKIQCIKCNTWSGPLYGTLGPLNSGCGEKLIIIEGSNFTFNGNMA